MMGLGPRVVDTMTLAELHAHYDGFRRFHGGEERVDEPDMDDFYAALAEAKAAGQA